MTGSGAAPISDMAGLSIAELGARASRRKDIQKYSLRGKRTLRGPDRSQMDALDFAVEFSLH